MKRPASQQHAIGGDSIGQGTGMKVAADYIPHAVRLQGLHQRVIVSHEVMRQFTVLSPGECVMVSFSTFYFLEED